MDPRLDDVHRELGLPRARLGWAKVELLFGMAAACGAIVWATQGGVGWIAAPLATLGAYLALAGHRAHLYDAMSRQTAIARAREESARIQA
jgi:hypothetical protein